MNAKIPSPSIKATHICHICTDGKGWCNSKTRHIRVAERLIPAGWGLRSGTISPTLACRQSYRDALAHRIRDVGWGDRTEASQRIGEGGAPRAQLRRQDLVRHLQHRVDRECDEEAARHRRHHQSGHIACDRNCTRLKPILIWAVQPLESPMARSLVRCQSSVSIVHSMSGEVSLTNAVSICTLSSEKDFTNFRGIAAPGPTHAIHFTSYSPRTSPQMIMQTPERKSEPAADHLRPSWSTEIMERRSAGNSSAADTVNVV